MFTLAVKYHKDYLPIHNTGLDIAALRVFTEAFLHVFIEALN